MKLKLKSLSAAIAVIMATAMSAPLYAIGGISAAKLAVPIIDTVPNGAIEFEPALEVDYGIENGNIFSNGFGNRITWGIGDTFEMGLAVGIKPGDVALDAGLKWNAYSWGESSGIALMTGIGWSDAATDSLFGAGLIVSHGLTDTLHLDFSTEIGIGVPTTTDGLTLTSLLGLGWYFVDNVQGCLEVEHSVNFTSLENDVTLYAGITWDLNESVILVFGQSLGVLNASNQLTTGSFFAATILID